jgi:ubiquinone/menaquinone biosynthesis C-methylase UbiE
MKKSDAEDHDNLIKNEFTRQSSKLQEATIFTDVDIISRITNAALKNGTSARVLDIGCGPGILTTALSPLVDEVVGLDLTPEMIKQARKRTEDLSLSNVIFKVGRAEQLPFPDSHFDVVVTRLMLHHLVSPGEAVKEIARVLRSDGIAVVADIITSDVEEEAELHNALETLRDPSHIWALTKPEFDELLISHGLKIIAYDGWVSHREFGEWIKITNAPERVKPLLIVMKALAGAGIDAGINLRISGDTVRFDHTWRLVTAMKPR